MAAIIILRGMCAAPFTILYTVLAVPDIICEVEVTLGTQCAYEYIHIITYFRTLRDVNYVALQLNQSSARVSYSLLIISCC